MTALPPGKEEGRARPPVNSVNSDGMSHPHRVTRGRERGISLVALLGDTVGLWAQQSLDKALWTCSRAASRRHSVLPVARDLTQDFVCDERLTVLSMESHPAEPLGHFEDLPQ